jgi:hypothetical protein
MGLVVSDVAIGRKEAMQVWSESSATAVCQGQGAPGFEIVGIRRVLSSRVRGFMKRGECAVTAASDTSVDIDITRRMLRQGQARVLVVGTERATGAVLRALRDDFDAPVLNLRAGGPLTLPEAPATLLIHDVSALDTFDQDRLHRWLNQNPPGISVIAVSSEPLFPLVQAGAFLTDLFYRLNLIVIDVSNAG